MIEYKGDVGLYLSGAPVPIPLCALFITQPTIKQVVQFGETNFLTAIQLLSRTDEFLLELREGNPELKAKTDFQLLMIVIQEDKTIQHYLETFFELTFPEYTVEYERNSMNFYLRESEEKRPVGMVTMYSFGQFQDTIKELFGVALNGDEDKEFNPANEAASAIAKKLQKARDANKTAQEKKEESNISLFGTYASILSIGLQMDINIFFSYTPFQIVDSFRRYWEKDNCDFYRKLQSTPMMDVSEIEAPKDWTRNFYPAYTGNN